MLLASAGVTVGLLGFALPAGAATGPNSLPATTQSTNTTPKLPQLTGNNNSGVAGNNNSGGTDNVKGPKCDKRQSDGNGNSRDNRNPCKSKKPEPCPTKPCRTEKPKPCHSWTWHKPAHTVPCHEVQPCKPPKKRPCPPVHKHHKKCDTRKLQAA